jgi:hypothetical protein
LAFLTSTAPIEPAAPALLSTIMVWPRRAVIFSAVLRPMISVGPAGANGTTRRMIRSGYLPSARTIAGAAKVASGAPRPAARR